MNDVEFTELQLRAEIVPQQARWPEPNTEASLVGDRPTLRGLHWEKLHACADEARQRVAQVRAAFDAIDNDSDLSKEGRDRKKKTYAADAIADFQRSKALLGAKDTVERQLAEWAKETGLTIKEAANIGEAVMYAEVRAHFAAIKENHDRITFFEKHATDPRVASAVLGAPSFLSALTDADIVLVQTRVERHVAPEIAKARDDTLKAMADAEQGWQNAIHKIAERAGLTKAPDGSWR